MTVGTRFCLDTSVFINSWRKHYRPDVFPSVWDALGKLIVNRTVFSCEEAYLELQEQDDDLAAWVKQRRGMFETPTQNHLYELSQLMREYPNFAATGGSTNGADPWVIVHAKLARATAVTDEQFVSKQRPTKPPKIPNVCSDLDIPWMGPLDFFAAAGIKL